MEVHFAYHIPTTKPNQETTNQNQHHQKDISTYMKPTPPIMTTKQPTPYVTTHNQNQRFNPKTTHQNRKKQLITQNEIKPSSKPEPNHQNNTQTTNQNNPIPKPPPSPETSSLVWKQPTTRATPETTTQWASMRT